MSGDSHKHLLNVVRKSVWDYEPFGTVVRDDNDYGCDCSCGCQYFAPLKGKIGSDWGVCSNPESHRCGLLTFEHQGCQEFKWKIK